jgi:AraC-type transcriptional regulator N-terminus
MKRLYSKRQAQGMQSNSEELIERMAAAVPTDGTIEAFSGFRLSRASGPTEPVQAVYEPSFCFVVQGSKKALLGARYFITIPGIT